MSREAVLGRRLLGPSKGASVASVLQGEMLSSKQITRCAFCPQQCLCISMVLVSQLTLPFTMQVPILMSVLVNAGYCHG